MSPMSISLVAFACICGGMLLGMFLQNVLPEHHVSDESKDAVKLGIGMIATMAALVIGLLIASAKGNFDTLNSGIRQTSSRVILLDRLMAQYGPEMMEARDLLRRSVLSTIERIWPEDKVGPAVAKSRTERVDIEVIQDKLRQLSPRTDAQRMLHSRALQVSGDIAEGRWLIVAQKGQSSLPMPFFVMLVFWLTTIFAIFGLVSPRNTTVIVVLLICSLSAAGSLFLVMELDAPYGGLIKVSSVPLHNALAHLGQVAPGPVLKPPSP
jgi:hypothetical protein